MPAICGLHAWRRRLIQLSQASALSMGRAGAGRPAAAPAAWCPCWRRCPSGPCCGRCWRCAAPAPRRDERRITRLAQRPVCRPLRRVSLVGNACMHSGLCWPGRLRRRRRALMRSTYTCSQRRCSNVAHCPEQLLSSCLRHGAWSARRRLRASGPGCATPPASGRSVARRRRPPRSVRRRTRRS